MKAIHAVIIVFLLFSSSTGYAENNGGKPGDDFRKAAANYEDNAARAVRKATQTEGKSVTHYLELSSVYREMATIKHQAAEMADQNRWNDINWDRYHELESRRDQLMGQVDWSQTQKQAAKGSKASSNAFIEAARQYEEQAKNAHEDAQHVNGPTRHLLMELSGVYEQMAGIKYQAASAANIGQNYDWSHYQVLEERRDQLRDEIKRARHKK